MKKLAVSVVSVFLFFSFLTATAKAADKLAYVDLSKLFSEYGKTKDYDKVLADKESAYTTERDKKVKDAKQLEDKVNLLSEKEKATKKSELDTKIKALQEFVRQRETDLRKEQDEKMKEILKDIETAVKAYAEKEGYTFVFNDRVLVYENKSYEITDQVLAILNKGYKK